ncbi:unnamed protein product [Cuscuta epithymum]|uniref:Uncharacterized protein n=1 Tax=Cuscuta epithymum TaxID=186058 RepID=A0AAV0FQS2_9ASTE|nr:unnamed protein product [Cuscuta epithymum]CAH9137795.1 unnamed protein product [Cuscuta epithymum]
MSRCFPYPPPGYKIARSNEEAALIESIKLQKEREKKARADSKDEKKREKREKRKERKERKEKSKQKSSEPAQSDKRPKIETSQSKGGGCIEKKRSPDSEQLERSNLTEEFGHAVCSDCPNNSSDSTQNSNKRKKSSCPPNVTRTHGNVFKIRLPLQKQNNHDSTSLAQAEEICSTSGRIDLPVQPKCELSSTVCVPRDTIDKISPSAPKSKQVTETPMQREEMQYRDLIEKLIPSGLSDTLDCSDDEDWLFKGKCDESEMRCAKKMKPMKSSYELCSATALRAPCAQFLQDVGIYALPFTIPF